MSQCYLVNTSILVYSQILTKLSVRLNINDIWNEFDNQHYWIRFGGVTLNFSESANVTLWTLVSWFSWIWIKFGVRLNIYHNSDDFDNQPISIKFSIVMAFKFLRICHFHLLITLACLFTVKFEPNLLWGLISITCQPYLVELWPFNFTEFASLRLWTL